MALEIKNIKPDSNFYKIGIRSNDTILKINNKKIHDILDFYFYAQDTQQLTIAYQRNINKKIYKIKTSIESADFKKIEFVPFKIKTCSNNCIFCFIKQQPTGLRKTLYLKDEDYRMSFLYGNYITMTDLSEYDLNRIARLRLSPIYISVHSLNKKIRKYIFGRNLKYDIIKQLNFLSEHNIYFHCQIVATPGVNDANDLANTISGLSKYFPNLKSIAVVPVGLTKLANKNILKPDKIWAENTINLITDFQKKFQKKFNTNLVWLADEFYYLANKKVPHIEHYENLYQYENGVGIASSYLIEYFLEEKKYFKRKSKFSSENKKKITKNSAISNKKNIGIITGEINKFFFKKIEPRLQKIFPRLNINFIYVKNIFFGGMVNVTGLLTGRDILAELNRVKIKYDYLIIPEIIFEKNFFETLDNNKKLLYKFQLCKCKSFKNLFLKLSKFDN